MRIISTLVSSLLVHVAVHNSIISILGICLSVSLVATLHISLLPEAVSAFSFSNAGIGTFYSTTRSSSITQQHHTATATPIVASTRTTTTTLRATFKNSDNEDDNEQEEEDDDDDYDPLQDGVDSVSWLPSLNTMTSSATTATSSTSSDTADNYKTKTEVLPFFPLGGIVYTPNSEHVLNIFEPRYRQMYTDILMNGSKRFVVSMSHPSKDATFAQIGVIFYLEDLKEVSELTDDQVKYICNHKVTNRVRLKRVLNPQVWKTRETYMKVECEILYEDEEFNNVKEDDEEDDNDDDNKEEEEDDDDEVKNKNNNDVYNMLMKAIKSSPSSKSSTLKSSSSSSSSSSSYRNSPEEMMLLSSFQNLVTKQHSLSEDVRFTQSSISSLAIRPGNGEDGLWQTIRLWQSFIDQRLIARQNDMQMEFQQKLVDFLKKEKGIDDNNIPSAIGFGDLSPALQQEVQDLQKRMNVELKPLVLESTLTIQKILEADDHKSRCLLLKHFMDVEKKRLDAKSTLKGMFDGNSSAITNMESDVTMSPKEQQEKVQEIVEQKVEEGTKDDEGNNGSNSSSQGSSLFMDEPDAFQ